MPQSSMPHERSVKRQKSTQYRLEIDPQSYAKFMLAIANGLGVASAAEASGITATTAKRWSKKGEVLADEELPPHSQPWQYARFWTDYKKSRATFELAHVYNINQHSISDRSGQ